jgi:hypothetical protein
MLEDIRDEWKKDSTINHLKIENEILRTALLHAKYLDFFMICRAKKDAALRKLNSMKNTKRRYYKGELTLQELTSFGWDQWQGLKPSMSEMNQLFEQDPELNTLEERLEYWNTCIVSLEYIIRAINSRTYEVKNIIEFRRFEAGA